MALRDLIGEIQSGFQPFVRGFGSGISGGLIRYPQALVSSIANGTKYSDELNDVRQSEAQTADEHPVAYYGGNVAGSFAPSAVGAKVVGTSLRALMGTQGLLGGIDALTANGENQLANTATGATLGALGGAAGSLGGAIVNKFGKRAAVNSLTTQLHGDEEWKQGARAILEAQKPGAKILDSDVKAFAKEEARSMVEGGGIQAAAGIAPGTKTPLWELAAAGIKKGFEGVPSQVVAGGLAGGIEGLVTGRDPVNDALAGAGMMVLAGKARAAQNVGGNIGALAGRVVTRNAPLLIGAPSAATSAARPVVSNAAFLPMPEKSDDLSQYEVRPVDDLSQYEVK